ncbi:MAG: lipoprotein insertase outer membrane protein LolB [Xanthomonadales bacterium]|nr:lipoprotein insertase outer membrane protein LolB [Xanthomonadales bacterium]
MKCIDSNKLRNVSRLIPALLASLFLSACASSTKPGVELLPGAETPSTEARRVAILQQQQDWSFKSRISIRIEENGSTEGGSGNLRWKQSPQHTELNFHAAFGRAAWHLIAGPEQAKVTLADGSVYVDSDVQRLLSRQLGWDVPVSVFSCWLRGLVVAPECPAGSAIVVNRDAQGRPLQLRKNEWQVRFHSWSIVDNLSLPKKIEFSAPGRKFVLVIKQWSLSNNNSN